MQIKEVKVSFEENGKQYSFDCSDVFVSLNQQVVVDTARGYEIGTIVSGVSVKEDSEFPYIKKIIRVATENDLKQKKDNGKKEQEIKLRCEQFVTNLKLDMKVISSELTFDGGKVVISFTADERVDFRELLKQLASEFRIRIELKQIDAREEAKVLGGLGPCGRECCCSKFLNEPEHSSIKMAKMQGISLNPTKINGLCGKLKCCLSYENEYYSNVFKLMPKINTEVITPDGKGLAMYNDLLKQTVSVKLYGKDSFQDIKEYPIADLRFDNNGQTNGN